MPPMSPPAPPFPTENKVRPGGSGKQNGPAAGHTQQPSSWAARLARTGQLNSHGRSLSAFGARKHQPWNDRIPVWEQCIPQWDRAILPQTQSSVDRGMIRQISTASSTRSRGFDGTVTRDWSLLFSPGRQDLLVRRPWPEYEPETSAAVGRRWQGTNLGRLHEHSFPPKGPNLLYATLSSA